MLGGALTYAVIASLISSLLNPASTGYAERTSSRSSAGDEVERDGISTSRKASATASTCSFGRPLGADSTTALMRTREYGNANGLENFGEKEADNSASIHMIGRRQSTIQSATVEGARKERRWRGPCAAAPTGSSTRGAPRLATTVRCVWFLTEPLTSGPHTDRGDRPSPEVNPRGAGNTPGNTWRRETPGPGKLRSNGPAILNHE